MEPPTEPEKEQVVDARLVARFAVCRDAPPVHTAELDARAMEMIARMTSRPGTQRHVPVAARAVKVVVNPSLTVVVIPGKDGVLMLVPESRVAFGARTEAILNGSPIGSIGPLVLGLAPDGVEEQSVSLSDGSTIQAPVVGNVYAVKDPSWTPPEVA